jgi:hypothetical protein
VVDDPQKPKRHGTVHGERNENRANTPRQGVVVPQTLPPPRSRRPSSFSFEDPTPPAMDPTTYHALQKIREEMIASDVLIRADVKVIGNQTSTLTGQVSTILDYAAKADAARLEREKLASDERERRRKYIVPIITALGIAIAGIIAAIVKAVG